MLKRQRQPSPPLPPPSSSSIPFIADTVTFDSDERHAKRRRTQPPVLDGSQRGWARVEDADADDGYWDDIDGPETTHDVNVELPTTSSDEYKATNSMLRHLHTLHQHRLSFSSQSSTFSPVTHDFSPSSAYASMVPAAHTTKLRPSVHLEPSLPHAPYLPMQKSIALGQNGIPEEAEVVSERYENINKYVLLFILRRHLTPNFLDFWARCSLSADECWTRLLPIQTSHDIPQTSAFI